MRENLCLSFSCSKKRCKFYASQWLVTTLGLGMLLPGLILIQACTPTQLAKDRITAPYSEAMDHLKLAGEYGKRGNYAQAETEATQAIYKCDLSLKRYFKGSLKFDTSAHQQDYFREIDDCTARGHALRGYALMSQGDLYCASCDFEWAVRHAKDANRTDFEKECQRLLNQVNNETKRTGAKGREECPPSVW
jgi:hypothetical protein